MTPEAQEIAKVLRTASNMHGHGEALGAVVDLAYCAFAKPMAQSPEHRERLEEQYMRQVRRWPEDDVRNVFPKAVGMLALAYANKPHDYLGELAGELGLLNASMGQFFTPMDVCRLMARLTYGGDLEASLRARPFVTVEEPAAGAGAMLLAMRETVEELGKDPMTSMWVQATELHYTTFQMCYLALNWSGVPALVRHGNSLSLEVFEQVPTVAAKVFYAANGSPWAKPAPRVRVRKRPAQQPQPRVRKRVRHGG